MLEHRSDIKLLRHCCDCNAKQSVSHNVYVHGTGRAALEAEQFTLGFPQLPWDWGAKLSSCAKALGTPSTCKCSRATKGTQVTRSLLWCCHWVCQRCCLHMNRKWTVKTREIAQFPQVSGWASKIRKGNPRFLGIRTPGGRKKNNQTLHTPRKPFAKDGKLFYTLFQNLSSIKS